MIDASLNLKTAHKNFLSILKDKGHASATILAYGADLDQLVNYLVKNNKTDLNSIAKTDLENFKDTLTKDGYTAKSISRKINSIRTFFKVLVREKTLNENPAASLSHPKYDIQPPRILTKMEYRSLRDACRNDIRISAIIELFLQTGMRIGELANLKLQSVKSDTLCLAPWESQPAREIPINKAAKASLENYIKIRPQSKSQIIFLTKSGKPFLIRNIRGAVNRYFKLAGTNEATVNDLRHTFIAQQLKSGAPLVLISKIVGHKRLSTTEKYLKFIKEKTPEKMKLKEL